VVALKGLERLDLRVNLRETRHRDPMEKEEVTRVLAEKIAGEAG
jgi:hypothetical protein